MDSTKNVTLEDLLQAILNLDQKVDQLTGELRDLKQQVHDTRPLFYARRSESNNDSDNEPANRIEAFDAYEGVNVEQAREIWDWTLQKMQAMLSKPSFDTWLKNTVALSYEADTLTIGTSNDFARDWLESRYKHHVEEVLHDLNERDTAVEFVVPFSI